MGTKTGKDTTYYTLLMKAVDGQLTTDELPIWQGYLKQPARYHEFDQMRTTAMCMNALRDRMKASLGLNSRSASVRD